MQKFIRIVLMLVSIFSIAGCSFQSTGDDAMQAVKVLEKKNLENENQIQAQEQSLKALQQDFKQLQKVSTTSSSKTAGSKYVMATELNIRQDPSLNLEPIGTLSINSNIQVIETSDPRWPKISLDLSQYTLEKEGTDKLYFKGNDGVSHLTVYKKFMKGSKLEMDSYYVSGLYVSDKATEIVEVPEGNRPFVYGLGLTAYGSDYVKSELWKQMKDDLLQLGYTGIQIKFVNKDTFSEDVRNGIYDAVESSSSNFAVANKDKRYLEAVVKTVSEVDGTDHYNGVVITNKESSITKLEDLKGKKIYTGKPDSASSYRYQKYYLQNILGIDIAKEAELISEFYHYEILLKVATGEVDAGFVGEFVMSAKLNEVKRYADKLKIPLENETDLRSLRENILVLRLDGIQNIPNSPHSLKKELYEKKAFTDKFKDTLARIYENNVEGFDLTDAKSSEYEFLLEFDQ